MLTAASDAGDAIEGLGIGGMVSMHNSFCLGATINI